MADIEAVHSSYRERLIEHLLIGQVVRELWLRGEYQVEVLHSEVDAAGYDIVLECRSVVRHVQLKAAKRDGKRTSVGVNVKLAEKPSGCVVWVYVDPEVNLGPFYWFGGEPGCPLPSLAGFRVGRHTKGDATGRKADRPNVREVPRNCFRKLSSIAEVVERLFGEAGVPRRG